jgi:hypothetical protein
MKTIKGLIHPAEERKLKQYTIEYCGECPHSRFKGMTGSVDSKHFCAITHEDITHECRSHDDLRHKNCPLKNGTNLLASCDSCGCISHGEGKIVCFATEKELVKYEPSLRDKYPFPSNCPLKDFEETK